MMTVISTYVVAFLSALALNITCQNLKPNSTFSSYSPREALPSRDPMQLYLRSIRHRKNRYKRYDSLANQEFGLNITDHSFNSANNSLNNSSIKEETHSISTIILPPLPEEEEFVKNRRRKKSPDLLENSFPFQPETYNNQSLQDYDDHEKLKIGHDKKFRKQYLPNSKKSINIEEPEALINSYQSLWELINKNNSKPYRIFIEDSPLNVSSSADDIFEDYESSSKYSSIRPKRKVDHWDVRASTSMDHSFVSGGKREFNGKSRQNLISYNHNENSHYQYGATDDNNRIDGPNHRRKHRHHNHLHQSGRRKSLLGGAGAHKVCERIKIPMCHGLPYKSTQMPNYFHQSTQQNARLVMDNYMLLVKTNCSRDLVFFLCSLYAPICHDNFFPPSTTLSASDGENYLSRSEFVNVAKNENEMSNMMVHGVNSRSARESGQINRENIPHDKERHHTFYGDNVVIQPAVGVLNFAYEFESQSVPGRHARSSALLSSPNNVLVNQITNVGAATYLDLGGNQVSSELMNIPSGMAEHSGATSGLILPCRHVCLEVKRGCEPLLKKFNISWPPNLSCQNFPLYELDICISPETIVASSPTTKHIPTNFGDFNIQTNINHSAISAGAFRNRLTENSAVRARNPRYNLVTPALVTPLNIVNSPGNWKETTENMASSKAKNCTCHKPNKLKKDIFFDKHYDYAIHAELLAIQRQGDITILKVRVNESLLVATQMGDILPGTVHYVWIDDSQCLCWSGDKFSQGSHMLICGHEDRDYRRLIFSSTDGIALPWKPRMKKRITKWARSSKYRFRVRQK